MDPNGTGAGGRKRREVLVLPDSGSAGLEILANGYAVVPLEGAPPIFLSGWEAFHVQMMTHQMRGLLDRPEDLTVFVARKGNDHLSVKLHAPDRSVGQLIGKGGCNMEALRTLMGAIWAAKDASISIQGGSRS